MGHHEIHARIREIERQGLTVNAIETGTSFMVVIADQRNVVAAYSKHKTKFDFEAAFAAFDDPERTNKRHPPTDRQNIVISRQRAA